VRLGYIAILLVLLTPVVLLGQKNGPTAEEECVVIATWHDNSSPLFVGFYRMLGGHPAVVRTEIKVRGGLVRAKRYSLAIEAPPFVGADGRSLTYYVEGNISTGPQADTYSPSQSAAIRQPEYQIGSNACLGCLEIHVSFTPSADPADVQRLSYINFACLTRQHACRTKQDIMPVAASEQEHLSN
jgi:hypothetical protein